MELRRNFLKLLPVVGASAAALSGSESWEGEGCGSIVGAWSSIHTLPFPPGSFREFLSFAEGGVVHETNSFLSTGSGLDFSMYGLPTVINAADGVGNWKQAHRAAPVEVVFRKLLFDGSRQNFGDLLVKGTVKTRQDKFHADWHIQVVDLSGALLADLGLATSDGSRLD